MTTPELLPNDAPATLRSRLRIATADAHARAEAAMPSLDALRNRGTYIATLAGLHTFYSRWETATQAHEGLREIVPDLPERMRLHLLEQDLRALGSPPPTVTAAPPALTTASALGALYVLEGSTLGGQVIRRAIEPSVGLPDGSGVAFFTGHAAHSGAMWTAFTKVLDAWQGSGDDVIAGAEACFADFEGTMRSRSA